VPICSLIGANSPSEEVQLFLETTKKLIKSAMKKDEEDDMDQILF
jgi:hypothetical protein